MEHEAMHDQRRLRRLIDAKVSARRGSDVSKLLVVPSRKGSEGWGRTLQRLDARMKDEIRAARKLIDEAHANTLRENEKLWQATLLIFGESPYSIFSRTKGIFLLMRSKYMVGDTSPIFAYASVDRFLSIISHPFLSERSTSETLRLFLQFSVIAKIGARTGWSPPLVNGTSDCPILDSPLLNELRKEMSLVSKDDHTTESIYERLIRLTKSHAESVETLILAKVGHFARARAPGSTQAIQRRQTELYNQAGICAVSHHELVSISEAIDDVASAKQEMTTERALEAFKKANRCWLTVPSHNMFSVMKKSWEYETCLSYTSQQSQISAEETPQQRIDNNGTTSMPKSAYGDLSEVHEPDQSNMTIECQITREVVAVNTEDDVMNCCCAAIDNAPRKSLGELWMDENPFENPV
ncbi:unnamed protein product [Clonostachys byssicola]|uniref:Uncharacterized protein n=1 Tax=Clonostachys byssicola TaxID=160290 RepID=A0A9N9XVI8_9HYPO|nr:unnamed protein product [Clonostachys byssicola]